MEFSRQEYWVRLPFFTPGDLPDPGIKPMSPAYPVLAGRFFTTESHGKPGLKFFSFFFFLRFHSFILFFIYFSDSLPKEAVSE